MKLQESASQAGKPCRETPKVEDRDKQYSDQSRSNDYAREIIMNWEAEKTNLILDPAVFSRFSTQKRAVIEILGDIKNKKILEFGCGTGLYSVYLSMLGADVIGIDIGKDIIEVAKRAAQLNGVDCQFLTADVVSTPFYDESFHYVIGHGVLHHLPPSWLQKSIDEAYRVLVPGGRAYFSEPVENSGIFNFLQNLIPIDSPESPQKRPSILQRKAWKLYSRTNDDRSLTDEELLKAGALFEKAGISYYGFLIRLARLHWASRYRKFWEKLDVALTSRYSPVKKLSQCALVCYSKSNGSTSTVKWV